MNDLGLIAEILDKANSGTIDAQKLDHLENMAEKEFITQTIKLPTKCPNCSASIINTKEIEGRKHLLECEQGHNELEDEKDYRYYNIDFQKIANLIAGSLGLNVQDIRNNFPDYLFCETNRTNLVIMSVVDTGETPFLKLFRKIITEKEPCLILTTGKSIENALEIQSVFSAGNLTYIMPVEELSENTGLARDKINHMEKIKELQEDVLNDLVTGSNANLISSVETNPKHLISYLNHLRLMKEQEGKFDWTKLEDLTSTAFSRIFVGEIDDSGGSERGLDVPDNLFVIHENGNPDITGIVDTKSNYKAKIDREKSDKHLNYFERVNDSTALSPTKKCLIFVVFDIQGETDLEFYNRVKDRLEEDEYVIVLDVDALITMLEFYLSLCLSNKLKFRELDINKIFGRLLDQEHLEMNERLRNSQRTVKGSLDQEEFEKKMLQANDLYYLSKEFVLGELEEKIDERSDLEYGLDIVLSD
jgi:hypothetical protein